MGEPAGFGPWAPWTATAASGRPSVADDYDAAAAGLGRTFREAGAGCGGCLAALLAAYAGVFLLACLAGAGLVGLFR